MVDDASAEFVFPAPRPPRQSQLVGPRYDDALEQRTRPSSPPREHVQAFFYYCGTSLSARRALVAVNSLVHFQFLFAMPGGGGARHNGAGASGTRTRQIAGGATAAAVSTAAAVFFVFMLRGNSTASFGANETYFSLCKGNCSCESIRVPSTSGHSCTATHRQSPQAPTTLTRLSTLQCPSEGTALARLRTPSTQPHLSSLQRSTWITQRAPSTSFLTRFKNSTA